MTGKFKFQYCFDAMMDDGQFQVRTILHTMPLLDGTGATEGIMVDAWATSYAQARDDLITIIQSIPDDEEIEICGI